MKVSLQHDEHYIASLARLQDDRVLKDGNTFAVFDQHGDINLVHDEQGVFHEDTRFLSRLSVLIGGKPPLMLGSVVHDDNAVLVVDLANPDIGNNSGDDVVRHKTLHMRRSILIIAGRCEESTVICNYGDDAVETSLTYEFAADFKDIFEVRGESRKARGTLAEPVIHDDGVVLAYRGLDKRERRVELRWSPVPDEVAPSRAVFIVRLEPREEFALRFTVRCAAMDRSPHRVAPFDNALRELRASHKADLDSPCRIRTSNPRFNAWLARSASDLAMVMTRMEGGEQYPYAGIPWYSTVFGRDGLIIALQTLWIAPSIARGVLTHLAARQADAIDPERDAEPGKILHEARLGEMAFTGEVPFREYYGTVDATPLFVMLAGAHLRATGDVEFARSIMPNVDRALAWMEECGDADNDGFVEYDRKSEHGLANQGWKDSFDSVMHADGEPAESPIALCEVQGYAYAAKLAAADMAEALDDAARARNLRNEAAELRARFDEAFWCEDIGMYALALDGDKRPCCVRSSNPGHCLYAGIVPVDRAVGIADALLAEDMLSGWGIRTLSASSARYSPMAYHNGTVWPHDNSIIAAGLSRYGMTDRVLPILDSLFESSGWFDRHRLPELFCGFPRAEGVGPVGYPVACSPQGWAAAAVFLLMQATLGLSIDARAKRLGLMRPRLPVGIDEMWIENLPVASASADLHVKRSGEHAQVNLLRAIGDVRLVIEE